MKVAIWFTLAVIGIMVVCLFRDIPPTQFDIFLAWFFILLLEIRIYHLEKRDEHN